MKQGGWMVGGAMLAWAAMPSAHAAPKAANDQPIEISSDKLDVLQDQHKAIFSGNVIASQGTSTMRSTQMTVFYRDNAASTPKPGTDAAPGGQSISRIEATGSVVFTTPDETALGDMGIYNVDTDTIDLTGRSVTLTKGQNVLKGTRMVYNMGTGRSVLSGGNSGTVGGATATGQSGARVHGLFMPGTDKK